MVISQTAEYALRAVVYLAAQDGGPLKTHDLAVGTKVPAGYLAKVLQSLARAGLVASHRGVNGGFTLTSSADHITVLDVVDAVDPHRRIDRCPLGLEGHGSTLCPLHRRIDDAMAQVEQAFASCTIGELLATPSPSTPLCEVPAGGPDSSPATPGTQTRAGR